jgi:2-dehydropantoate 2-reductase
LLATLKPGDIVLLLQNGMGVDEWLRQLRPDLLILTGITTDGVYRTDRHHLVLAGEGRTLLGGESPGRIRNCTAGSAAMAELWHRRRSSAGHSFASLAKSWPSTVPSIPLTALYRCRNGELEHHADAISTMRTLCAEVAAVMQAEGIPTSAEALFRVGQPDRPANGRQHFLHAGRCHGRAKNGN